MIADTWWRAKTALDALPRGIAIHQMFKTSYFGQLGARYLLVIPGAAWPVVQERLAASGAPWRAAGREIDPLRIAWAPIFSA